MTTLNVGDLIMGGRLSGRAYLGMITAIKRARLTNLDYYDIEWYNGPQRGTFPMYAVSHTAVIQYREAYLKYYGQAKEL